MAGSQASLDYTSSREVRVVADSSGTLASGIADSMRRCGFRVVGSSAVAEARPVATGTIWVLGRRDFRDASTGGQYWKSNWNSLTSWSTYIMWVGLTALLLVTGILSHWPIGFLAFFSVLPTIIFGPLVSLGIYRARPRSEYLRTVVLLSPASPGRSEPGASEYLVTLSYGIAERSRGASDRPVFLNPEPVEGNYEGMDGFVEDLGVKFAVSVA
jgi:hypothetical protein